jgi:hypothetical protein
LLHIALRENSAAQNATTHIHLVLYGHRKEMLPPPPPMRRRCDARKRSRAQYEKDEGTRRAIKMYGAFAPIVMSYRALELKHTVAKPPTDAAADAEWTFLHKK